MAEPIKYESQIPAIAQLLLGQKQGTYGTTTSTNTANVAPLEQVFAQALQGGAAGVPEMQQLITSIFQEGARQVPELTAAYANATGSRSRGNSGLQLALTDLNRQMTTAAATAMLQNQVQNRQVATQAGGAIAQATKATTENKSAKQTTGTKVNPIAATLAGWGLNKLDKRGVFDKIGDKIFGAANDPAADVNAYGANTDLSQAGALAGDPYGSGTYDVGIGGGADISPPIDLGDAGFGAALDPGTGLLDDSFNLSDAVNFDGGFDPGVAVDATDLDFDFAGFEDAFGGMDLGFADGGAVSQRNRNYMGDRAPISRVSALNSQGQRPVVGTGVQQPTNRPRKNPRGENFIPEAPDGGPGQGEDGPSNGIVGTPSQNAAITQGFINALAMTAFPQLAVLGPLSLTALNAVTGGKSLTSAAIGEAGQAMGLSAAPVGSVTVSPITAITDDEAQANLSAAAAGNVGSDGISPDSVAAATGIDGMNEGGLAGLGVSLGLSEDATGSVATSASDGIGSAGDGSVGDAASAGVGGGGFADGGMVRGPGTGTSDSIKVNVSDGEYIFPPDVVRYFGTRTLDRMKSMIHQPAHMRR